MSFKSLEDQKKAISKILQEDESIPYYRFKFGKFNGCTLEYVFNESPSYLKWLYSNVENLDELLSDFINERLM